MTVGVDSHQQIGITMTQSWSIESWQAFWCCNSSLLLWIQDNPDAHKTFLRVNRAYEVLKDEDLRKKYDMYGEDGLKEGGPTGQSYQSWRFYDQDFGMLVCAHKPAHLVFITCTT